jgi:hypothetical protein
MSTQHVLGKVYGTTLYLQGIAECAWGDYTERYLRGVVRVAPHSSTVPPV